MKVEKSQIKFVKSEMTGELIGFVSSHPKTKQLRGVREQSGYGKKICVLSEDLKGEVVPNVLYDVELKQMHNRKGYVVISATPIKQKVQISTNIVPHSIYQVTLTFGYKIIYFDPLDGKSNSSKTIKGVVELLNSRKDIGDKESVINEFKLHADYLVKRMQQDGYNITEHSSS
ncbi:hypothetical protein [Bacteroides sp. 51]|uniref:hypothetical protein n=1 Tax=Bacteroides sp. 51 TaxID=2302938 RepID=UPI0013D0DD3E|nr:hypothetical protein [Bacteroides sp. 51]NDV80760.1 hypothetical protein [Bacteroides sp. 51]